MTTPKVLFLDEVDSTNTYVRCHFDELPDGAMVAARFQSAGRGRQGRRWLAPPGANLSCSIAFKQLKDGFHAGCLTALAALELLEKVAPAVDVYLKWPNDLLARERKLGGILVEAGRADAGNAFAVCGIGINLEISPRNLGAICLAELGDAPSFSALAEALRDGVVERVDAWARADGIEPLAGIRGDYLAHLAWRGEKVRVLGAETGAQLECGTFEDVDPWGRAVVGGTSYAAEQASLRPAP